MSTLLKDRVWVMLSEVAKRGIYPLHASRLGVYRMPVELTERSAITNVLNELKSSGFKTETFADRIYVTNKWTEQWYRLYHQEKSVCRSINHSGNSNWRSSRYNLSNKTNRILW